MKRTVGNGSIFLVAGIFSIALTGDAISQRIRDHRDPRPQEERLDAKRGSPSAVEHGSTDYLIAWINPRIIPSDFETWLNKRMIGLELIAVAKDNNSGHYNSFFTRLPSGSWNYKVMIVPEADIQDVLTTMLQKRWKLVTLTSEWHGTSGLQHICFFRQV